MAPSPGACSTACSTRPNLSFEGVVATSAGAMNAAVLAYGLAEGGKRGAQKALANFWRRVSHAAAFSPLQPSLLDRLTGSRSLEHSPAFMMFDMMTRLMSPYQFNPLNFNPLKGVLEQSIDLDALRMTRCPLKVNLCATNVRTGKVKVFSNDELSIDAHHGFGLPALPVPGGRDRRRGLLGRRLYGQSRDLPADLFLRRRRTC